MSESTMLGQNAPDFQLQTLDGQAWHLGEKRGVPVFLTFFESNCAWCRVEVPKLADTFKRHPTLDVAVLGVVVGDDDAASAQAFAAEKEWDLPLALDADRSVRALYQLTRVPSVVVIDAQGLVARVYEGSAEQLSGIVEQTLLSAARGDELPDYSLVGNGCSPG